MVISWPSSAHAIEVVNQGFQWYAGLQGVLGAINGSHMPIKAPGRDQDAYINRKGFHSVVLQAVCTHHMYFADCFAGYPGSTHDARVFRNSDLFVNCSHHISNITLVTLPPNTTHALQASGCWCLWRYEKAWKQL